MLLTAPRIKKRRGPCTVPVSICHAIAHALVLLYLHKFCLGMRGATDCGWLILDSIGFVKSLFGPFNNPIPKIGRAHV